MGRSTRWWPHRWDRMGLKSASVYPGHFQVSHKVEGGCLLCSWLLVTAELMCSFLSYSQFFAQEVMLVWVSKRNEQIWIKKIKIILNVINNYSDVSKCQMNTNQLVSC